MVSNLKYEWKQWVGGVVLYKTCYLHFHPYDTANFCLFLGQHQSTLAHQGVHWAALLMRTHRWWRLSMGQRPACRQVNSAFRRDVFDRSAIATIWAEHTCTHHLIFQRATVRVPVEIQVRCLSLTFYSCSLLTCASLLLFANTFHHWNVIGFPHWYSHRD